MCRFNLSQELVDSIVDQLVADIEARQARTMPYDPRFQYPVSARMKELKVYALINRAFMRRSQKYLFSVIEIRPGLAVPSSFFSPVPNEVELSDTSHRTVNNILQVLERKPYLAMHVRRINTSASFGPLARRYEIISTLLHKLRAYENPKHLFLRFYAGDSPVRPPDYSFQSDTSLRFPHIQHLHVSNAVQVPISFIANNPELQTLVLENIEQMKDDTDGCSLVLRPKVKHLTLRDSGSFWRVFSQTKRHLAGSLSTSQLCIRCIFTIPVKTREPYLL
ncbi:hypothetical protein CVT24_011004 [Panaeolus cyanescens]|uniref:Uncharacterized protein n=1 Tax=Panaeolus cyanescens TaxID=181874 RepID=A0A409YV79_9AGAR|nr:hypothetical protein CVT24_011004 [Panaeolus cyanescens]